MSEVKWVSKDERLPGRSPVIGGRYTQSSGQWVTGVIHVPDLTGGYWQYWLEHPIPPPPPHPEPETPK